MKTRTREDARERFFRKVDKAGPVPAARPDLGPCWNWTAFLNDGYGRFWFDGFNWQAHRWLYEQTYGPIPQGHEPDHLCNNRACVRLDHLEIVTQQENLRRSGALHKGRRVGNAVLLAAKTHCPKGHPYDEANTRHYQGHRACRACGRATYHARKASSCL